MKLNNNGWGLRVAIGFIFLFVCCLIFSVMGLNKIGMFSNQAVITGETNDKNNVPEELDEVDYYEELETSVYEAIQKYSNDNPTLLDNKNSVIINLDELIEKGYISDFKDTTGYSCKGYAEVFQSNTINFSVFIKCPEYKTSGYDDRKEL